MSSSARGSRRTIENGPLGTAAPTSKLTLKLYLFSYNDQHTIYVSLDIAVYIDWPVLLKK